MLSAVSCLADWDQVGGGPCASLRASAEAALQVAASSASLLACVTVLVQSRVTCWYLAYCELEAYPECIAEAACQRQAM